MSMYKKLADGTLQKLAGYTVIADGSCAEVRKGAWSINVQTGGNVYTTTVTFTDPMPDTDYAVILEMDNYTYGGTLNVQLMVYDKTTTGFKIKTHISGTTAGAISGVFTAIKLIPMEGYTELKNKVDNPDTTPTENSTNLCTSGGIYDFVKNASSIFVGTSTEWASATQTDYDIAVITDEHIILSIDKTAGTTAEQANLNKIWQGAEADWEALPVATKKVYDFAVIKDAHYILSVDKSTGDTTKVASLPVYDVARSPDWTRTASVTKNELLAGWTAPEDGVLVSEIYSSSGEPLVHIWVNNKHAYYVNAKPNVRENTTILVSKDDVIKCEITGTVADTNCTLSFVPYKSADSILEKIYSVGALYFNTTDIDPAEIFGFGTWERVAQNMTLWGASADGEAGTTKAAGLPNISGNIDSSGLISEGPAGAPAVSGVFRANNEQRQSNAKQNTRCWNGVDFNASRSSPIYGASTTVQPPALVVNIWRRTA